MPPAKARDLPMLIGSACWSIARSPTAVTSAWLLGCVMPDYGTMLLSRMSITAYRAVSNAPCSTALPVANGSMRTTI